MLRNEIYIGRIVFNKNKEIKHPDGKRTKQLNPQEEWVISENAVPAIMDMETWKLAQQRIEEKRGIGAGFHRRSNKGIARPQKVTLLQSMVVCTSCGMNYNQISSGGKQRYRGCYGHNSRGDEFCSNRFRIRADELNDLVLDAIDNRLLREEAIQYLEQRMKEFLQEFLNSSDEERQRLLAEKQKVDIQIGRFVNAIGKGVDISEVHGKLVQLKSEENRLGNRLNQIDLLTRDRERILSGKILETRALAAKERIRTLDDEALLNEELKKHIEWIKVYPNGKIVMRGKRTGLLEGGVLNLSVGGPRDATY